MVQATKLNLTELADALRNVVMAARRQSMGSAHDKSVVALLAHLTTVGPLRAGDLAEHACLDASTVSRHLRSLETDGYLVRTPDPEDGRATLLQVTKAGERVVADARQQRLAMLSNAVTDWSEEDIATLTRLTRRLAESLEGS
ncbi:MAG: MarR family transcriptional regulator [Actinomycetia bacterium]|nr:MarR family transcriptional regulator [Actinomycetes bacterium]